MKVSKVALAAATILGGSALLATPALAQQPQYPAQQQSQQAPAGQQAAQPAQPQLSISRAERTALAPLEAAIRARDWTAAQAALPAAQAAARGEDARYFVARATWTIGNQTNNTGLEAQALAQLVTLANTPANERPVFLSRQAELAFNRNDFQTAEAAFVRLLELTPNDPRIQQNLSVVRQRMGNTAGALEPLVQQIRTGEASGQRAPEEIYRRVFDTHYRGGQRAQASEALGSLLRAHPTAANWRVAVDFARESGGSDNDMLLDIYRLARVANVIQPREYVALAQMLEQAGLPGETKAVLDAGIAAGAVQNSDSNVSRLLANANRRTAEDRAGLASQMSQARAASNGRQARIVADALYGYGRYGEAADLYRVALSKGEDANLINTRLGATLALGGQRAEAEAALNAVTGPRAELARFWLLWLQRRPA